MLICRHLLICANPYAVTRRGRARSTIPTESPLPSRDRAPRRLLIPDRLLISRVSAEKRRLTAVARTSRRIRKRSFIRISDGGDRRVLLSTRGQSIGNCPSPDREVVRAPSAGLNRIGHATESEADLE